MLSTPKSKAELFLASSLRDGLEDNDMRQVKTLLLSKEADPNVLIPSHGISPFHLVIGNESETFAEEVTKLFLRHGGNPNVKSVDGMTPVHVAAAWGRVRVLELLLANGGDPLCLDDDARSPFHYAFDGAYYDAVSVLGKYCGMNRDDENEDEAEPKYKLTLDKIVINKGNCVAEYVPSETSCSISVKTEGYETPESVKQEPQAPQVTSTNFRKSSSPPSVSSTPEEFSHLNSDNVTLRRNQKRPTPPKTDEKLDITFGERSVEDERLLIGEIINRLSNTFVNSSSAVEKNAITSSDNTSPISNTTNNASKIKKYRRFLPSPKYHSYNLKSKEASRKLLADTSIVSKSPNFRINGNEKTPTSSKKKVFSPKFYTRAGNIYSNKDATPPSKTSRTPEFRIKSASSTPKRKQYRSSLFGSVKLPKIDKSRDPVTSIKREKPQTIFDKTYRKDRFGVPAYSPDTEISRKNIDRKLFAKNIAINLDDRMYDDNLESKACQPTNAEETPSKKLVRRLRSPRIYNNIKPESGKKRCNVASSESNGAFQYNFQQIDKLNDKICTTRVRLTATPNSESVKCPIKREKSTNVYHGPEKLNKVFESPGSSLPVPASRHECPTSSGKKIKENFKDDDTKIWLEIEEAFRARCGTPPASVSMLNVEDSPSSADTTWSDHVTTATFYSDYGSEDASTCELDKPSINYPKAIMNTGMMASRCSAESFVSVDEEYTYEDAEEGVAFIERHLCVIPSSDVKSEMRTQDTWIERYENLSLVSSGYSPPNSPQGVLTKSLLDEKILRERLTALGEAPGPITKTTLNVYLKRLWRLERAQEKSPKPIESRSKVSRRTNENSSASRTIPEFLLATDWTTKLDVYRNMEEQAFKEYATTNPRRKYRGGISKTSFCYLLLDPRITRDLPRTALDLSVQDRWIRFLEGIFYVGKGKAARPAAHLYDAFGVWSKRKELENHSRKIRRILDIWQDGQGVVCLHVFSHTILEEACSREAAMIDALETAHLTNCIRGTYYGYTATMNAQEKRTLGKYLLYKAMEIFMHEGERQLFPRNVIL